MSGSQKLTGKTSFTVRFWPKADISGRILNPKLGCLTVFGLLSVRYRPKADTQFEIEYATIAANIWRLGA